MKLLASKVLATSCLILSIGTLAADSHDYDPVFDQCAEGANRNERTLLTGAAAWPISLSRMPDVALQSALEMRDSAQRLEVEIRNFPAVYQAAVALAGNHCPALRTEMADTLRQKFVIVSKLRSAFKSTGRILRANDDAVHAVELTQRLLLDYRARHAQILAGEDK